MYEEAVAARIRAVLVHGSVPLEVVAEHPHGAPPAVVARYPGQLPVRFTVRDGAWWGRLGEGDDDTVDGPVPTGLSVFADPAALALRMIESIATGLWERMAATGPDGRLLLDPVDREDLKDRLAGCLGLLRVVGNGAVPALPERSLDTARLAREASERVLAPIERTRTGSSRHAAR